MNLSKESEDRMSEDQRQNPRKQLSFESTKRVLVHKEN